MQCAGMTTIRVKSELPSVYCTREMQLLHAGNSPRTFRPVKKSGDIKNGAIWFEVGGGRKEGSANYGPSRSKIVPVSEDGKTKTKNTTHCCCRRNDVLRAAACAENNGHFCRTVYGCDERGTFISFHKLSDLLAERLKWPLDSPKFYNLIVLLLPPLSYRTCRRRSSSLLLPAVFISNFVATVVPLWSSLPLPGRNHPPATLCPFRCLSPFLPIRFLPSFPAPHSTTRTSL